MKFDDIVSTALDVLKGGGVILYPTDTVWGIGGDATNEAAVQRIFAIKRRSESKSLVLLASDLDMICRYVKVIPQIAIDLVELNDVPMTIVYPGAQGIAPSAVAEDGSVGIRIPLKAESESDGATDGRSGRGAERRVGGRPVASFTGGELCRQIARRLRRHPASYTANISGEPSPRCFEDISPEIAGAVDFVVPVNFGDGAGHSLSFDSSSSGRPSQIIKLGLRGEVEIIRK